jgi:hypothetical protein
MNTGPVASPRAPLDHVLETTAGAWQRAVAGDEVAQAAWQVAEGGIWSWVEEAVVVRSTGAAWACLSWDLARGAALRGLSRFSIEVTITGRAALAGISFGPWRDFLIALDTGDAADRLHLEIDVPEGAWTLCANGRLVERGPSPGDQRQVDELLRGVLTLKASGVDRVAFSDLSMRPLAAPCRISVVIPAAHSSQRLRVVANSWCEQTAPTGTHEILIGGTGLPGEREVVSALALAYPEIRIREIDLGTAIPAPAGSGINQLARSAQGEWIWLTDGECLFPPQALGLALESIARKANALYFCERRRLGKQATYALLAGRLNGRHDLDLLLADAAARPATAGPWLWTQIVPRSTLERFSFPDPGNGFTRVDERFVADLIADGMQSVRIEGLFCLGLDCPAAWYTPTPVASAGRVGA